MVNNEKGSIRNQFFAVLTVNIITFNQGTAIGWVSPAMPILLSEESPLGSPLTQTQVSLIASTFCIGALIGTLTYGWLSDKLGRKKAALTTAIPFLICWSIKLFWPDPNLLIFGRLIAGFGGAGILLVAPIYSSELASVENRGALGTMLTLTFNVGILFVYVIGEFLSYKMVLIILISFPIIFLGLMIRMPESPSVLVKNGQYKEAAEAIAWFRQLPTDSPVVQKEVDNLICEMKMSSKSENKETSKKNVSSVKFLLSSRPSLRTLSVTASLLGLQSCMGMFAILSYASEIFKNAGSSLSPGVSSIMLGLLQLCGSFVATSLIERLGRKVLLMSSAFIVSLAMATLGTYFYVRDSGYDVTSYGLIPVISLSVTVFTFSIGIGPVPFILPSEMFMMQVRGLGTSLSLTMMWLSSFLVAQFFQPLASLFGSHSVFWGFSVIGCMAICLCYFCVPETKGTPLEDIVAFFGGRKDINRNQDDEAGVPLKNMASCDKPEENIPV